MPEIHVTLLGRFAVTVGGVPVAEAGWKRRHAAAVVKVLALAPGRRREAVAELDPGDERAHLALMRRHAADGDRHAALRQFDRPDLPRAAGIGEGFLRSRYDTHSDVNRGAYDRVVRIYHN
jgi:DNA-binding SARP family transcriptional activator